MPIAKAAVTILASVSVAAGSTKAAPNQTGAAIDCRAYYGGEIGYKITNGTAPGAACVMTFQSSHDGIAWYDYATVAGDTTLNSITSGSILVDRGVMYLRAIAYGNTTNAVTVEAYLQAVTAV